ncbi:MAG: pyridoxal phosphate-dependent aminotransferase family protein [Maribacter sp.]
MEQFPKKLLTKLSERRDNNALRRLPNPNGLIDFSSNDYLGLAKNEEVFNHAMKLLKEHGLIRNGATGSRLLSGNHELYFELERKLADFHKTEAALVFNSGYDANIGFFSTVPQRGDIVFYDELIHASIRDGIKMGNAKSYKFKHDDLEDLKRKCHVEHNRGSQEAEVYIVTESVFSMDGDSPDLQAMAKFCTSNNFHLVVDEAHAIGVYGENGVGLVQEKGLQDQVFARIITFGKAIGCHGAAILGSNVLINYLVNFARSFIYTTGLPPHSMATIIASYKNLSSSGYPQQKLQKKIQLFNLEVEQLGLQGSFIKSSSAIHCCIVPGNDTVKSVSQKISDKGFDVRPILSPTVATAKERLRFCVHSYNSTEEIKEVLRLLDSYI